MNKIFRLVIFLGFITTLYAQPYMMRFADVSDKNIVFSWENDLWLVDINGGEAHRLTTGDGLETFAKFSPNGQYIAFTANYDGGRDIYVMNIQGGIPKRVTYHPANDRMLEWFPDGKHLLFRSIREYPNRVEKIYKVSIEGGMPEEMPVDQAGLTTLSPDGKSIAYNRGSREFRNWKRHKGGTAQDIWVGNLDKKDYKKITKFDGTDNFPMWIGSDIYFTSDRYEGTLNLYKYDTRTGRIAQVTKFTDYDVKYPSAGGSKIIFQYAEELYIFDVVNQRHKKVYISIPSDHTPLHKEYVNSSRYTGAFGLDNTGDNLAMDIRGEIFNIPTREGIIYNLTQSPKYREKNPAFSPDGKQVVYISDLTGEEELFLKNADGSGDAKQLTKDNKGFRKQPKWSPDGTHLIFHDKYMQLNLVDAKTGDISIIDKGEYDDGWYNWGIQDYSWSPDSRWIAYAKLEQSMYQSIFLYSLDENKIYRVTSSMTQDWSPSFSPDGKYLYFLSNRTFNAIMGAVDQNHIFMKMAKPYILVLNENDANPLNCTKPGERVEKLVVTTTNFEERIIDAGVAEGNYFRLDAIEDGFLYLEKDENVFLKYQYVDDSNTETNLDLYKYCLKDKNANKIIEGVSQYHVSGNFKKLVYKAGSKFGVVEVGAANVGDGAISLKDVKLKISKANEFEQIFNEAWRVQRDFFYDKNMHGVNWEKVGAKYRRFVRFASTREDINYLIGEMIAELNVGHTYIYGGDSEYYKHVATGLLGARFVTDKKSGLPKVDKIYPDGGWSTSARSPLGEFGCPVKEGYFILAIDGYKIEKNDNIYKYLENKAGRKVELTYNSKPTMDGAEKYITKTEYSEASVKYNEWVNKNLDYVTKKTDGKVGYVHIPNMMDAGCVMFAKYFYPQWYKKGLVIDARYNGGGFTSRMLLDRLERQLQDVEAPREGKRYSIPERVYNGYLVLLINKSTGSDGELFSDAWKDMKLGPVVGQRTWGGAVGIEAHQHLLDGATTTPPQFAKYNLRSEWVIEGHGVDPDIIVVNMPSDVMDGKDAQLDKALEILLEKIAKDPREYPAKPQYQDKSKKTLK